MLHNSYPYELPPLPYSYDALEPYIDAETMHYHHDKHFGSYVAGLNAALAPFPQLQRLTLERLLSAPALLPKDARDAILHNGGGVYNHALYFDGLAPAADELHAPHGELLANITRRFQSFDQFKAVFTRQALAVFGSGWTCLALTPRGALRLVSLKNQDTLLPHGGVPLLLVDVWEHAYYLKYKNLRAEYLENIWNVLTFPVL